MLTKEKRSKIGKKARQAGARFERIVRDDLISKGWNVSKFQSNVEFKEANWLTKCSDLKIIEKGKLIPAKGNRFRARTLGFPDFICWKIGELITNNANKSEKEVFDYINKPITKKIMYKDCKVFYKTMGVEAKSDGYLDKIEKAKCEWLLKNKVFSHILIAKKTKKGRKIIPEYIDFKEKYQSIKKKRKC